MTTKDKVVVALTILVLAVAAMMLSACGDPQPAPPPPPPVCATYQAPDGTWMEEDNEEVDDDPCDLEFELDDYVHKTKSPAAKPNPKSTPQRPAPKKTR